MWWWGNAPLLFPLFPLFPLSHQRVELLMQINIRKLAYAEDIFPCRKAGGTERFPLDFDLL